MRAVSIANGGFGRERHHERLVCQRGRVAVGGLSPIGLVYSAQLMCFGQVPQASLVDRGRGRRGLPADGLGASVFRCAPDVRQGAAFWGAEVEVELPGLDIALCESRPGMLGCVLRRVEESAGSIRVGDDGDGRSIHEDQGRQAWVGEIDAFFGLGTPCLHGGVIADADCCHGAGHEDDDFVAPVELAFQEQLCPAVAALGCHHPIDGAFQSGVKRHSVGELARLDCPVERGVEVFELVDGLADPRLPEEPLVEWSGARTQPEYQALWAR